MEANNIVAAPQLSNATTAFQVWKRNHTGSLRAFYESMTTPGPERDEFITLFDQETAFNGAVASRTIKEEKA